MFKNNFCTVLGHTHEKEGERERKRAKERERERAILSSLYLCTTMFNYRKFFDIIMNYDRFRVKVYMAFSAVNNKMLSKLFSRDINILR